MGLLFHSKFHITTLPFQLLLTRFSQNQTSFTTQKEKKTSTIIKSIKNVSTQPTNELPSNSSTQPESTTSSSSPSTTTTNATASKGQQNGSNSEVRKTEAEEAADRLYEERIEEEYAKREGGA